MQFHLNRELKAYCADFAAVREILRAREAVFVEISEQVDYYYHLPAGDVSTGDISAGTRRLKLRVEKGTGTLIHYREHQEAGARTSRFQLWSVDDLGIGEVLEAALGARAVVRKQRELWRKDNVIFNLDNVEGVGQILEVEVKDEDGCDIDQQLDEYRSVLGPVMGSYIVGSNEDLISALNSPPLTFPP